MASVQFLAGTIDFSFLSIQIGYGAHPASSSDGIRGSFLKGKVSGA
jgi:hypothetical protein